MGIGLLRSDRITVKNIGLNCRYEHLCRDENTKNLQTEHGHPLDVEDDIKYLIIFKSRYLEQKVQYKI